MMQNLSIKKIHLFIPTNQIVMEKNIRETYSDEDLEELGDDIKEHGQHEPCIVYQKKDKYVIKIGHRRYRACVLREIPTVDCIVKDNFKDEIDRILMQASENEQRLNLSPVEREKYLSELINLGMSQADIANRLHKNKGWVSEALKAYETRQANKDILSGLIEDPSTRDTWKASSLSTAELDDAVKEAQQEGGTKEAFKKAVNKKITSKKSSKNKINNDEDEDDDYNNDILNTSDTSSKNDENNTSEDSMNIDSLIASPEISSSSEPAEKYNFTTLCTVDNSNMTVHISINSPADEELGTQLKSTAESYYLNKGYTVI